MSEPEQPVSEVPLESAAPTPRGRNLVYLVILAFMASSVAAAALWWLDSNRRSPDHHTTKWPNYHDEDYYRVDAGDYDGAVARMQKLADALLQYREGPEGGGVRWPNELAELQMFGVLEPDFDMVGTLSGEPIVYQPDMPVSYDPARWVLCHDIEIGWRMVGNTGYRTKGPRAAAVVLADGTVKLLLDEELDQYGGLNLHVDSTR